MEQITSITSKQQSPPSSKSDGANYLHYVGETFFSILQIGWSKLPPLRRSNNFLHPPNLIEQITSITSEQQFPPSSKSDRANNLHYVGATFSSILQIRWSDSSSNSSEPHFHCCLMMIDPTPTPGGGHSTFFFLFLSFFFFFFQVEVCGPDFRSVGLANWYLLLKEEACELKISKFRGLWTENFQIWGLVS